MDKSGTKTIAQNRKAYHDYFVEDRYEAGIELFGTEVKSIRAGTLNLKDAFCVAKDGEVYAYSFHISPYDHGNIFNRDPDRPKRLLLHKREIRKLHDLQKQEGYALIPLSVYFKNSRVKVELGLCKGKKTYDKREAVRRNAGRWFNRCYSVTDMLKTLTLMPWSFFPGFRDFHMPQPFLKETFVRLWNEEAGALDATCRSRFRTATDLSQWLVRYEQLASGRFRPVGMGDTKLATLSEGGMPELRRDILSGRYAMICMNDSNDIRDTGGVRRALTDIFDALLPEKSAYER